MGSTDLSQLALFDLIGLQREGTLRLSRSDMTTGKLPKTEGEGPKRGNSEAVSCRTGRDKPWQSKYFATASPQNDSYYYLDDWELGCLEDFFLQADCKNKAIRRWVITPWGNNIRVEALDTDCEEWEQPASDEWSQCEDGLFDQGWEVWEDLWVEWACKGFLKGSTEETSLDDETEYVQTGEVRLCGWVGSVGRADMAGPRSRRQVGLDEQPRPDNPSWAIDGETNGRESSRPGTIWWWAGDRRSPAEQELEREDQNLWNSAHISSFETDDESEHSRFLFLLGSPEIVPAVETNSLADAIDESVISHLTSRCSRRIDRNDCIIKWPQQFI